jgi:hypothetical protein
MLKQILWPFGIKRSTNKMFATAIFSSVACLSATKINLDTNN